MWLCRLGHDTRHFNVGQYRRVQKGAGEVQDASFFDPSNEVRQTHLPIPEVPRLQHSQIELTCMGLMCSLEWTGWAEGAASGSDGCFGRYGYLAR